MTEARRQAEGLAAAFMCSLVFTALLISNRQLQSLDWPYFFIFGSSALLVALVNVTHLWWQNLWRIQGSLVKWVILRGLVGSASNTLSVCAILCGAHAGSVAAFRSVNSLVGSLGTLALGEDFGWMHLLSVTLYIVGAILTADPEEIVATMGSTLLGHGLALASGICSGCAAITGRKVSEVHPSVLTTSNMFSTWTLCWTLHFATQVPSGSFQSMEGARLQSLLLLACFPFILHCDTIFGAIASQKCSPAAFTTIITAVNMLLGYALDYLIWGHSLKLPTLLGATLIFLAVLTMLLAQIKPSQGAGVLPKESKSGTLDLMSNQEISNLLPLEGNLEDP